MTTFALAALVLIMMPGPDQALITRNALVGGRSGGLLTMVGGVLGLTVHAAAAAVGLSALLLASATAFTVLKIAGTAYLLWLAVQLLRSAARSRRSPETADELLAAAPRRWAHLRQGFLSNALNPKVALFFVTFLPQFLSGGAGSARAEALLFSAVFALLYLAWFGLYILAVDRLGRWLRRPAVKARIEQVTGVLLAGVAIRLATAANH
ncbi:LysE family translocator [Jiangella alkaliphila]|uniref:Threonine/homoserine/homoserine lactone efflux protein n=1 Tax=Jiangella alkaliphila TaxID=419479 RepID=A0A1H2LA38_9ACTN|nr:LysE family translocator [Jiangella alkaliphila]SDU77873.1 Threonine/homoserine/homoserine lactone efflux protein [Jiangella alkaliphila]